MAQKRNGIAMTQGRKYFAAGGDHFAALLAGFTVGAAQTRGDHGGHDRIEPHLAGRGIRPDR